MSKYATQLRAKQVAFAAMIPDLIKRAFDMGYEVTLGDAYRDPRCPYGSASSKHKRRLAIDLNLFKDGVYLTTAEDHRPLGEYWESVGGIWGGRFGDDPATPAIEGWDANHYEWPDP